MGCFGSRLDKRASAASESLDSVGLQFVAGEGCVEDKLSADNFVFLQGVADKYQDLKAIYPTADGKATDETGATKAFVDAYKFVEKLHKEHDDAITKDVKAKGSLWQGKFTREQVRDQLADVIASFKKTEIPVPADAGATTEPVAAPTTENAQAPDAEATQNEGGEEGETVEAGADKDAGATTMAKTDPREGEPDDQEYKGFAEVPACFLRNAIKNEVFGDLIKQRIVAIQFKGAGGLKVNEELAGAAGYITSGLATSAREAKDAWFSGMVGELDQQSLAELKKDAVISFPGWMQGWAAEDDANNYVKFINSEDKKGVKQVVIKVTGAPVSTVPGFAKRLVAHRLKGALSEDAKSDETTGVTTVTVAAKEYDETPLQESWVAANKKEDPPAATPPATTDAAPDATAEDPNKAPPAGE